MSFCKASGFSLPPPSFQLSHQEPTLRFFRLNSQANFYCPGESLLQLFFWSWFLGYLGYNAHHESVFSGEQKAHQQVKSCGDHAFTLKDGAVTICPYPMLAGKPAGLQYEARKCLITPSPRLVAGENQNSREF